MIRGVVFDHIGVHRVQRAQGLSSHQRHADEVADKPRDLAAGKQRARESLGERHVKPPELRWLRTDLPPGPRKLPAQPYRGLVVYEDIMDQQSLLLQHVIYRQNQLFRYCRICTERKNVVYISDDPTCTKIWDGTIVPDEFAVPTVCKSLSNTPLSSTDKS